MWGAEGGGWGRVGHRSGLGHSGSRARASGVPLRGPDGGRRGRGSPMPRAPEALNRDHHPRAGGQRDSWGRGPSGALAVGRNLGPVQPGLVSGVRRSILGAVTPQGLEATQLQGQFGLWQ